MVLESPAQSRWLFHLINLTLNVYFEKFLILKLKQFNIRICLG